MGNSSSTSGGHGHHHGGGHHHQHGKHGVGGPRYHPGYPGPGHGVGGYDDGWSHSLETPEQRNRMKRGYFPPRGMPQPQKVLPVGPMANPNKLLKATSNGQILHNGGTISGRKLSELELEIRKRSTVSCPPNNNGDEMGVMLSSGRSTPNLLMPRMGLSSSGMGLAPSSSSSRSRDYGSEPDLRDVGRKPDCSKCDETTDDRSSSPLPNSFTLISESPSKKQIRSRKKSKAPPPPPGTQMQQLHPHDPYLIPYQYQLQQNPQRQLLLTPVSSGALTPISVPGHGHPGYEEKKKSRLFKTKAESRSAMNSPALRSTPTPTPNELISRISNKVPSHQIEQESKSGGGVGGKVRAPNPAPLRSKSPNHDQTQKQQHLVSGGSQSQTAGIASVPNKGGKNVQGMMMDANQKKTFYFGMDMGIGTFKQKKEQLSEDDKHQQQNQQHSSSGQNQSQAHVTDLHKEISRRKMIQKLDNEQAIKQREDGNSGQSRSSSRNSAQNNNSNAKKVQPPPQQTNINGHHQPKCVKPNLTKVISSNSNNAHRASESDSDGIHRRQDSGSFDINEKKILHANNAMQAKKTPKIRESSSDLSSSDLDVPLVVTRPTLPQKRPELPRFSPTAAWRAIDSPSRGSNNSGRSFELDFSGGEGDSGRLGRFSRPSAPPRISAERSGGDSGISAGDGSPANAIPLLLEEEDEVAHRGDPRVDYDFDEEFSSSSPPLPVTSNKANKTKPVSGSRMMVNSSRGGKHNDSPGTNNKMVPTNGADRKMKCWTPEQDLDESSSDFDQDNDPILPPVPPKPGSHQHNKTSNSVSSSGTSKYCNLFEGKRTSAVVSDSDSKYFGGNNRGGGFSSTDELSHTRRYHGRTGAQGQKDAPNKQKRLFNPRYRSPASATSASNQTGFVGLDTNWFLSRSEPNSLNFVGIGLEESKNNFRYPNKKKFAPPPPAKKKQKPKQPVEVIVGRNRRATNNKKHFPHDEDELECELQLDEEFDSLSSSDPNNKSNNKRTTAKTITTTTTATKKNNNFVGVVNKNKRSSEIGYGPSNMNFNNSSPSSAYEDQVEELEMRDEDESEELMRDDLFDYLDQYEEGEFEREQELTTSNNPHNNDPFPELSTTNNSNRTSVITINHRNSNDDDKNQSSGSRPFSHHIMYLPSYDARKIFNQKNAASWRRTRSVDALDASEQKLFQRESSSPAKREKILHIEVEGRGRGENYRKSSAPPYLEQEKNIGHRHHVSNVTITSSPMEPKFSPEEEERRAINKKKFKFQSTLRVQERRKIEAELSREAEHREEERLREIEEMKRVEEEFQKKRRAKAEAEAREKQKQTSTSTPTSEPPPPPVIVATKKFSKGSNNARPQQQEYNQNQHNRMMSQRQEPEGAPASVTVSSLCNSNNSSHSNGSDLRKELISASKKRSGNPVGGNGHQTQELSEYRQETRQYCDYRRGNRQQSLSPARFIQKSSSDIFPIPSRRRGGSHSSKVSGRSSTTTTTTIAATVHPEVVCDIPVKPHPYMVNAFRLNGSNSTMHLGSEERPNSVLGSAQNLHFNSSPSSPSVVSGDNYRRDWAHHLVTRGGGGGGGIGVGGSGSGRASSVMSLHSATPTATSPSDNFRNSTSDLSRLNSNVSPGRHRTTTGQGQNHGHMMNNYRQYSASPPPSASPVPSSIATDSFHQMSERSHSSRASPVRISSKTNTTVISIGPQLMKRPKSKTKSKSPPRLSSSIPSSISAPHSTPTFQAQPYNNNKARGYRPVAFKPSQQPQAPTTAVN